MSERIEDGGPIHPIAEVRDADGNGIMAGWRGMSLRDWFAGQALNGLLEVCRNDSLDGRPYFHHVAKHAYQMADEMLKARAPSSEPSHV